MVGRWPEGAYIGSVSFCLLPLMLILLLRAEGASNLTSTCVSRLDRVCTCRSSNSGTCGTRTTMYNFDTLGSILDLRRHIWIRQIPPPLLLQCHLPTKSFLLAAGLSLHSLDPLSALPGHNIFAATGHAAFKVQNRRCHSLGDLPIPFKFHWASPYQTVKLSCGLRTMRASN